MKNRGIVKLLLLAAILPLTLPAPGEEESRSMYIELIRLKIESVRKLNAVRAELASKEKELEAAKKALDEANARNTEMAEEMEVLKKEMIKVIKDEEESMAREKAKTMTMETSLYELAKIVAQIKTNVEKLEK